VIKDPKQIKLLLLETKQTIYFFKPKYNKSPS